MFEIAPRVNVPARKGIVLFSSKKETELSLLDNFLLALCTFILLIMILLHFSYMPFVILAGPWRVGPVLRRN